MQKLFFGRLFLSCFYPVLFFCFVPYIVHVAHTNGKNCDYGSFFGSEDHWEEVDARRHALWWLWRPILDLQALEQDGHVNVVSVTGWLAVSFRRCRFSSLLEVVCCGLDRSSPLLSVLCQCFPLTVVYASLCQLPLQLVLETLAGGTTVALALARTVYCGNLPNISLMTQDLLGTEGWGNYVCLSALVSNGNTRTLQPFKCNFPTHPRGSRGGGNK